MEVYEKINSILKTNNVTKRWFAKRLRELEPKLKSTGEIPTEKAIYGYLNGTSNIKIELIPYITEVLHINETELFTLNSNYKTTSHTTSYIKEPSIYEINQEEEMQKLISLLPFAPKPLVKKLIKELEGIKRFSDEV